MAESRGDFAALGRAKPGLRDAKFSGDEDGIMCYNQCINNQLEMALWKIWSLPLTLFCRCF